MQMHINDNYPPKPMWKMIVAIMGRIIIITLIFIVLLFIGYEIANSDVYEPFKTSPEPQNKLVRDVKLEQDKILNCLQKLENREHLIKWHDVYSDTYGDYALKLETITDLFKGLTLQQAEQIATNPIKAREVARYILFYKKQTSRYGYATNPKSTIGKIFNGRCEEEIDLELLK